MRTRLRLGLLAAAGLTALTIANAAWAAYEPRLLVMSTNNAPGRPTTMLIGHAQEPSDDPTLKDTIYVPRGYGVSPAMRPGTKIGDVEATIVLRQLANVERDVTGEVRADEPNQPKYTDPFQNRCAPGLHTAVWVLTVTVEGTQLAIPLYVDLVTAGPEATFASAKIQFCLQGPVGTPGGAQLLSAIFDVNGVFTNPTTREFRVWRAVFIPYMPGTPNPNPAGTVEGQAFVPSAVTLALTTTRLKRGVVVISGRLLVQGSPFAGVTVEVYSGQRRVGRARTNRRGRFTIRKRIRRKTTYRALAVFIGDRNGGCMGPPLTAAPCRTATIGFIAVSSPRTVRPRR